MFRFEEADRREPKLIIVPMVDVMLFLIAFYALITGSVLTGISVKTTPPKSLKAERIKVKEKLITVSIKADGSLYLEGKRVSLNDLPKRIVAMKRKYGSLQVAINGDKNANLQSLIDVMDAIDEAGVKSIGIITKVKR